jgi:hypothetical protein
MTPKLIYVRALSAHDYFRAAQITQDSELKSESLYLLAKTVAGNALDEIGVDDNLRIKSKIANDIYIIILYTICKKISPASLLCGA